MADKKFGDVEGTFADKEGTFAERAMSETRIVQCESAADEHGPEDRRTEIR